MSGISYPCLRGYLTPLRISLGAEPRSCVVQKIIIGVIYHTFRAKMNHLPAFDMPDNQKPRRALIAAKAFVRNISIMKTITFFIMVIHINCLKVFLISLPEKTLPFK